MKKILISAIAIIACVIVCGTSADAQVPMQEKKAPIGMSVGLKSNHLWRGYEVSQGAAFTGDMYISTWDESFKFGLWSGYAFNGNWKELDYYASYTVGGFSVAIWDIFNFSPEVYSDPRSFRIFNYNARTTGHFVDLSLSYRLPGSFPLGISVATVIFGRDRSADYLNGTMIDNELQRYSTYITLDYPILRSSMVNLDISCSGALALQNGKDAAGNTLKSHFYGNTQGIVNVSLTASRTFDIGDYKLPVSLLCMWNPQANTGNMQVAFTLLQF